MRHCANRQDAIAFLALAFIKPLHLRLKAHGKMRRFTEGPRQVSVAGLAVILAFLFAVTDPLRADTAAVRSIVACFAETID